MISFACKCGQPLQTQDGNEGKTVCCPRCQQLLHVPFPGQNQDIINATLADHEPKRLNPLIWFLGIGAIVFAISMIGAFALIGFRVSSVANRTRTARTLSSRIEVPDVEMTDEDYAVARRKFKTNLIHAGPSPQQAPPFGTPQNARRTTYKSGELELPAIVTNDPGDGKRHPAVLFLHIGSAYGDDDWMATNPIRDAGYVVMVPLLRGQNGNPGSFSYFYDEVDDLLAAAKTLSQLPYVDPEQVLLCGHGEGASIALLAGMVSDEFLGIGAIGPHVNFNTVRLETPFSITFVETKSEIQMRSPLAFIKSLKCPAKIYQGSNAFANSVDDTQTATEVAEQLDLPLTMETFNARRHELMPLALPNCLQYFAQLRSAHAAKQNTKPEPNLPEKPDSKSGENRDPEPKEPNAELRNSSESG